MGVNVGRGAVVAVAVGVGKAVCVEVTEGVIVRVTGVLSPQADRKITTVTIDRNLFFMETQLYSQAV